jgi:hypothetical protein
MQLTSIIGPVVSGFAIAWIGVANTYWFDVISYCVVIGSLLLMVVPRVPIEKRVQRVLLLSYQFSYVSK